MTTMTDRRWRAAYDEGVPTEIDAFHVGIPRLLDGSAAEHPDRPCLTFDAETLDYAQVRGLTDRVAGGLRALGHRPGDRIALLLPNCPPFVLAHFGALKAGLVVVPLNPLCTPNELARYLRASGARTVVTLPALLPGVLPHLDSTPLRRIVVAGQIDQPGDAVIRFETLMAAAPTPADDPPADAPALLMFSGGTTGTPKAILLSHGQCVANARQGIAWGHLHAGDRFLAVLPLFHGFGLGVTLHAPIGAGAEVVLLPRFDPGEVLRAIERHRPTFFIGVPAMFAALTAHPDLADRDLSSLEGVFVGAAPLTRAIKEGFEAATGARMIEGYGLTEAVTAVMGNPYRGVHKIGSVGVPFPSVDAAIVDRETGAELPPGEQGEIVLRSPSVMLGYADDPVATAAVIRDGWLHTGDVGRMDQDGYFYVTDRIKDLIIVGGFNVYPHDVDEVLEQHPAVRRAAVVGVPDARRGERIRAYVELAPHCTVGADELIDFAKERLLAYKVPAEVVFRSDWPLTPIGKVLRRALRDQALREIAERSATRDR